MFYKHDIYSQNTIKIDSLNNLLENTNKYNKISILYKLADNYMFSSYSKSLKYANKAVLLCDELLNSKHSITQPIDIIHVYRYDKKRILDFKSKLYSLLGELYFYQDNYEKSLEYFKYTLKIHKKNKDKKEIGNTYNNLGIVYRNKGDYNKALDYYKKALDYKKQINNKSGISATFNNIGVVYEMNLNNLVKAIEYYKKAYNIDKEIGNLEGLATSLLNIADILRKQKDYTNSIIHSNKCIEITKKKGFIDTEYKVYESLYKTYKSLKKYNKSLFYHEKYSILKDSLINIDSKKQINELEIQYETEKKNNQILLLNNEKEISKYKLEKNKDSIKKQQIIIFFITLGFISIVIFSIAIFKQFKHKQLANQMLIMQNAEIMQQKEEIESQRDEIESQRNYVTSQKQEIENKNKHITDSILYAQRIQNAILPKSSLLSKYFENHFILYKPKDIVSGDYYYIKSISNKLIVAVADCTGHGVPGAFLSMLGYALMNEIVTNRKVTKASELLNILRDKIVESLNQSETQSNRDGIDMAFVIIDFPSLIMEFSGAYNPVYIIRKNTANEKELIIIKGDKMPIGVYYKKMHSFTNHRLQLQKGDNIYMFSDGYVDQFGGEYDRKFMLTNFKNILLKISDIPMEEQKIILENSFNKWKKDKVQIDDILIVGLKV